MTRCRQEYRGYVLELNYHHVMISKDGRHLWECHKDWDGTNGWKLARKWVDDQIDSPPVFLPKTPYAQFRFNGQVVVMNRHQFTQAVSDGKTCRCGNCLACRATEYAKENQWVP